MLLHTSMLHLRVSKESIHHLPVPCGAQHNSWPGTKNSKAS